MIGHGVNLPTAAVSGRVRARPAVHQGFRRSGRLSRLLLLLILLVALPAGGEEPFDAAELVRRAEDILRGDTAEMRAAMVITTPRWTREVKFHLWDDRLGDRSFIRILEPSKNRGMGFLRLEETFWTYLPRVERTMRIPPSMMLQPWMGSDFTNDDLARESSMIDDYIPKAIGEKLINGVPALGVDLIPKEEAPVVWARVELWVEKERLTPLLILSYDEPEPGEYELLRRMTYSDIREVQGRPMPHSYEMVPTDKPGQSTRMTIESVVLDQVFEDGIFTQRNLRRAERGR